MNTPNESKSQDRTLTTTSFGVLAILSLRDHSTYDLIRQMRMSLHYMWPRAESNVYAEPKRLVEAGLAKARDEWNGQRKRTVYTITDAGRAALSEWLRAPSSRQRYESEALLKVLFAENGSRDDLVAALEAIAEDAAAEIRHFLRIAKDYEAKKGQYAWRFGLSALAARGLLEQQAATLRWAEWAKRVVANWDGPLAADAAWGVETLLKTGQPFDLSNDPVGEIVDDLERDS